MGKVVTMTGAALNPPPIRDFDRALAALTIIWEHEDAERQRQTISKMKQTRVLSSHEAAQITEFCGLE